MGAKLFVAALVLSAFAAGPIFAEDLDVRILSAKLAAQEAALRDLEAKASSPNGGGAPERITSIRRNAAVTVGGAITTGVYGYTGRLKDNGGVPNAIPTTSEKYKYGSMQLSDTELHVKIDVNENFDAFLLMDLSNGADSEGYALAKEYYVRWKNICDTGFGLKIGRDRAAFGDGGAAFGYLDTFAAGNGDGSGWWEETGGWLNTLVPHNGWKYNGVTQITPYWEGLDGKLELELSFMQNVWNDTGSVISGTRPGSTHIRDVGGVRKIRSRNYGLGSMSGKVAYSPIEDLTFTVSAINFRSGNFAGDDPSKDEFHGKNNTAAALSFSYRPGFFNKLAVWGQWVRGWNVNNVDGLDSDAANLGISFDVTDSLTVFAQGDYVKTRFGRGMRGDDCHKGRAWAAYAGAVYSLPYGVTLEAGWRHESVRHRDRAGDKWDLRGDTVYANIGFEF